MLVKDLDLGMGQSLEDLMLEHMSAHDLNFLTEKIPTLTIFVPSLPGQSFSCESWDVQGEVPDVAIKSYNSSRTYCFDALGNEYFLESNEIPGYPIVVLKANERIKAKNNQHLKASSSNSRMPLKSPISSDLQFEFVDDVFNNVSKKAANTVKSKVSDNLLKVMEAYDVFPNNTVGWQRDYIYYGLTKDNNTGPFDLRYKEHIVGFKLRGNTDGALNKISDQTEDPKLIDRYGWFEMRWIGNNGRNNIYSPWTDGEFEFEVIFKVVSKALADNAHSTRFRCSPETLFDVDLRSKTKGILFWKKFVYQVTGINFLYCPLQVPLFEWDLEKYGSSLELVISEFDNSETITTTSSSSSEFATNFGFDAGAGEKVKIGLKYGASTKETVTSLISVVRTLKSDELGSVIVNFGDEVVMSKNMILYNSNRRGTFRPDFNKKYFTDYYEIHISPVYTGR